MSGEWAAIRDELHTVTIERDRLAAKIAELQEILRRHRDYDRFELIEALEEVVQ